MNQTLPEIPVLFDNTNNYDIPTTQKSALLDGLYKAFPDSLHPLMTSSHFSNLVVPQAQAVHSDHLKKLCTCAANIFPDIPANYISNAQYKQKVPKNCLCGQTSLEKEGQSKNNTARQWGVTGATPGAIAGFCIKTAVLLAPDTQFSHDELGKILKINYVLIMGWNIPCIKSIVRNINYSIWGTGSLKDEIFDIDRILLALNVKEGETKAGENIALLINMAVSVTAELQPPTIVIDSEFVAGICDNAGAVAIDTMQPCSRGRRDRVVLGTARSSAK
ncbi:hypothetical protein SERLA73DRAFT_149363 [Serpula lacrymans var. lacrymans S7.3]|uniref:Uncharacterized protein n=1 Tax=Serpula lacrymans var. lacrymans (strain S7.3) TaxID=936435 RepID=F8PI78_SERL3|nr:hypothetical protein SERLA73DRAFT_149363 [Serpula lacrymans var. lacrymans S7.3]